LITTVEGFREAPGLVSPGPINVIADLGLSGACLVTLVWLPYKGTFPEFVYGVKVQLKKNKTKPRVLLVAQWNMTSIHEDVGSISGLTQ